MFDIRILRSVGLLLAILSLVLVIGLRAAPESQGGQEPQTYVVQPGDSLWTIAEATGTGDLQGSTIQAGIILLLPPA
jgi:hypothetical protein